MSAHTAENVVPSEWSMQMEEGGETFPFVEDENANITGIGHQDPAAFAAAVNRYDAYCLGESFPEGEQWTADHIGHRWAVHVDDGEALFTTLATGVPVTEGTPGAMPITTLWGQR